MIEEDRANMKKSRAPEAYAKKLKNDKRRGISICNDYYRSKCFGN